MLNFIFPSLLLAALVSTSTASARAIQCKTGTFGMVRVMSTKTLGCGSGILVKLDAEDGTVMDGQWYCLSDDTGKVNRVGVAYAACYQKVRSEVWVTYVDDDDSDGIIYEFNPQ